MRKESIGNNGKIVKLYPEDGYKLTNYDDTTEDIIFFACYDSVATTERRAKNFYEISEERAVELESQRELALSNLENNNGEENNAKEA